MSDLFIPSGARVPKVALPPVNRPIRLADGRALYCKEFDQSCQMWHGPEHLHLYASVDETEAWGPLLHVSVSYGDVKRRPSWEDLSAIKAAFFGDVDAAMILPKREDYVNLRDNCFHIWQIPQRWGIR